ncbi:hypothetical protein [Phytoactinopolyspora limicola]|uniref:hypothetical protein n=1 Tax=Phytoactinopolyspora limicola TaxID=2715536 RepID=UPI00140D747C|nr:hypothetical protein [Phytoactinopolyspora limicola]
MRTIRPLRTLLTALVAGATLSLIASPVHADEPSNPYLDEVLAGWQSGNVYVDASQHLLMTDDAAASLAARVDGNTPPIHIAVVPAVALSTMSGRTDDERGVAFVQAATERIGADGHYFVVFGGSGTYSGSVGVGVAADQILVGQLDNFTRGEPAGLLNAVLDELGVPSLPDDGTNSGVSPVVLVGLGAVVVLLAGGGLFLWRRMRRSRAHGPALYRPSFDALPDEMDTLEGRQALAREDVTRFGEEISSAGLPLDDPAVAADVQAAMDAYSEVGHAVDADPDDLILRAVRARSEYGRWRLACGKARLAGEPLPARRVDCFFDARHGVSVTDWLYTPAGGVKREVPVCANCRDERMAVTG